MAALAWAQKTPPPSVSIDSDPDLKLPDGKTQREELLKLDYKRSLDDAAAMAKLAEQVGEDLGKNGAEPLKTVKKLDDIERFTKTIRSRLRLPGGKSQRDEPVRLDSQRGFDDAAAMALLAERVHEELERDGRYVVSLNTARKLDDIERLARTIRGRLKKY